ncbi:HAD family phosphatase [Aquimarina sp. 2201CG1-2-11]|uniref:HAD family hydrolase n=1 Tax=Aquimarina discodermiae TaxID=3231043 RepID=UPI003463684A
MIKTIIFDFGDVFINLDKPATLKELYKLGNNRPVREIQELNKRYEVGALTTKEFISDLKIYFPTASDEQLTQAWNAILLDFPKHRLEFICNLAATQKYKLLLFSNTNELHINWIKKHVDFFNEFKSCFDSFYLSHEVKLRKPNTAVFEFILHQHQLIAEETLFIDDTKENTDAAAALGIHTWNNNPITEDVTNLFTTKSSIF